MDKTVSVAEAKRKFSELLRAVRRGRSYTITSLGKPIARISPILQNCDAVPAPAAL